MSSKANSIAVFFLGPFPTGTASAARVLSYCKAIAAHGFIVNVYIIAPTQEAKNIKRRVGQIDGVSYEYVSGITWNKPPNLIVKFYYYLIGLLRVLYRAHKEKSTAILTYHNTLLFAIITKIYCSIYNIPFIIDKTEYPYYYHNMGYLKRMVTHFNLKLYSGIITITKELENFYLKFNRVFHLPMTVSSCNTINETLMNIHEDYIGVIIGNHNRDGLFETIKVYFEYLKINSTNAKWNLCIVGNVENKPNIDEIRQFIMDNELSDRVRFLGSLNGDLIPEFLKSAKCLLTTPSSFPSGGFPTKLGEYLLSGRPVVSTILGEISYYLQNEIHFFGAEPFQYKKLAYYIDYLCRNPLVADEVALRGREIALTHFNASTYVDNLINFIYKVNS